MMERAAISLTAAERETLLALIPLLAEASTESALVASTRDRLEGKSLAATAGTNFGRDKHEAALGSTVTSVQLSVEEVDLLRARLVASETSLRDALEGKLALLREALVQDATVAAAKRSTLAEVAASVGLVGDAGHPKLVPVTVLTGCLGAGKTTVIRSLLRQLPAGYTCAWLKNEYGDAGVDRMVANDERVAVKEIVNGCLCCTKVGDLADALRALHDLGPHRILVEASGSALPGPLVWEIEKASDIVRVDGVLTVVDCANFARINNFSRTAKIQAKCTDLVLLNKVELAGEDLIENVLDDLNELVPEIPKVRTQGDGAATDPAIVFGLDAALWRSTGGGGVRPATMEEMEHMATDSECYHVLPGKVPPGWGATRACLEALMRVASPDELYRTKGILPFSLEEAAAEAARQGLPPPQKNLSGSQLGDTWWLFNGVAGRLTLEPLEHCAGPTSIVFMGQQLKLLAADIERALALPKGCVTSTAGPRVAVQIGERMVSCGVARGLSTAEVSAPEES